MDADPLGSLAVNLTRNADNSALLTVIGNDGFWNKPATLNVLSPGKAHVCQPRHGDIVASDEPANHQPGIPYPRLVVSRPGHLGVPAMRLQSRRGLYFRLCWSSNAPVGLDGSYLSASLPEVAVQDSPASVPVTIVLVPHAGDTSSYSLQATPNPSQTDGSSWTWSDSSTSSTSLEGTVFTTTSTPPIYVAAVNAGGTQEDALRALFAGILLGIAGAALVAILQELISPLSRRRDARHPV